MEQLPEDLLADVLRRLAAGDLAAARCVHSSWRAAIDARRLMQLAPLPLAGIFISFCDHYFSELFAHPTPPRSPMVSGKLHQYMPTTSPSQVTDHCNGLLLFDTTYVVNPAARRWAALPYRPQQWSFGGQRFCEYEYIMFDPAVSPHYEVVVIPHLPIKGVEMVDGVEGREWPPSAMMLPVYSSATNMWEERSFVRQGEALGTVADVQAPWPGDYQYGVYWRRNLYVHHNFIMRYLCVLLYLDVVQYHLYAGNSYSPTIVFVCGQNISSKWQVPSNQAALQD